MDWQFFLLPSLHSFFCHLPLPPHQFDPVRQMKTNQGSRVFQLITPSAAVRSFLLVILLTLFHSCLPFQHLFFAPFFCLHPNTRFDSFAMCRLQAKIKSRMKLNGSLEVWTLNSIFFFFLQKRSDPIGHFQKTGDIKNQFCEGIRFACSLNT